MKKLVYILSALCVLLLAVGVVLTVLLLNDDETVRNVTLDKDGRTTAELAFCAQLNPSESREYSVVLHGGSDERLNVTFTLDNARGELAKFIEVELSCDGLNVRGTLAQLQGKRYSVLCDFSGSFTVTIRLGIPADVGNDAMGKSVDFDLLLQADRR